MAISRYRLVELYVLRAMSHFYVEQRLKNRTEENARIHAIAETMQISVDEVRRILDSNEPPIH